MKDDNLVERLVQINTHPENRKKFIQFLLTEHQALAQVVKIASTENPELSPKAARALEFVSHLDCTQILPFKKQLFSIAKNSTLHSVIRPSAKILEILIIDIYSKLPKVILKEEYLKEITEICFQWMITPQKTAAQAHSMQSLYLLGKTFDWIHPELKLILEKNYPQGSAGYQVRARKIIQQIENIENR